MIDKVYLLKFFVFISIVKRVIVFQIADTNCIYKENGATFPNGALNVTIDFFMPFNWEKWNENHELIITSNQLNFVLTRSSNQNSSEWMKEKEKFEFLTLDYLRIGWNRIWLSKSHQNVVIRDTDGNIWLNKSSESFQIWNNWKAHGLFAFVNCEDHNYRYFQVHGTNNKIPLEAKNNQAEIKIYSAYPIQMDINFSRRKEKIIYNAKQEYYYIKEDDPFNDSVSNNSFPQNAVHRIVLYLRKDINNNENSLTFGKFTCTDFLIHNLDQKFFLLRTEIFWANVPYSNFKSHESGNEPEEIVNDNMTKIILSMVIVLSLVAAIIFLIAYIRERRLRLISTKATEGQPLPNKEKQNTESASDNYSSYELRNGNYEKFSLRKEGTPHKIHIDQYEGSEIFELNNSLYEDLDQRKSNLLMN